MKLKSQDVKSERNSTRKLFFRMGKMLLATNRRCIVLQRAMIHRWGVRLPPAAWLRLRSLGHLGQAEYDQQL